MPAARCALLGLLALSCLVLSASATSLRLQRSPHRFQAHEGKTRTPHASLAEVKPSLGDSDVQVPMTGGLLTLGAYFVNMSIGKTQFFDALVDTGSSNIWVTGFKEAESKTYRPVSCGDAECRRCNVDGSKSCLFGPPQCDNGQCGWGITYGGGGTMSTGVLGTDEICFAGADSSLCTSVSPFGEVRRNVPKQGALGAIIGLAFPRNGCNPSCVTTLYDGMKQQQPAIGKKFSMCLTQTDGGVMDFGPVNQSRLSGPVVELKVTHEHWYNLAVVDLQVDGAGTGLPHIAFSVTNDVIGSFVDSGTSVLAMGPLPFASLQQRFTTGALGQLPGVKELWNGQCVPQTEVDPIITKLPPIDVHIDATGTYNPNSADIKVFSVPPSSYLLKADKNYCLGIAEVSFPHSFPQPSSRCWRSIAKKTAELTRRVSLFRSAALASFWETFSLRTTSPCTTPPRAPPVSVSRRSSRELATKTVIG
jgi:Eukaryotic aspartyl protease